MEKLEIISKELDVFALRCKGWCHDYSPAIDNSDSLPSEKYFT